MDQGRLMMASRSLIPSISGKCMQSSQPKVLGVKGYVF